MATGPRDTSTLVTLTGWDATVLNNWRLQENVPVTAVLSDLNTALAAFNAEINNDPLWASLVSYQDAPEVEYRMGASNGMNQHTEYGRADTGRGSTDGHLLPLIPYDRALGWTWDYLRQARVTQIQADITEAIKDARARYRVNVLTRLLKRGDDSGTTNGLGSSGYSPGFATTAAQTSVDFTPPDYAGNQFASTHEHYVGIAGGVFTLAVFQDAKSELREHGHEPPYSAVIGPSDETTVRGLSGFIPVASANVRYGNAVDLATLPATGTANGVYPIGILEDTVVHVVMGLPQYYGFVWKSYGPNSTKNPIRVRLTKGESAYRCVAMPDPRNGNGAHPLQWMMLFCEFGVGVSDRTNGTPRYVNSATWADGTPT